MQSSSLELRHSVELQLIGRSVCRGAAVYVELPQKVIEITCL